MEGKLRAVRLQKNFGTRVLFQELSLSVAPGKILALLGPSGIGKSTLLKVLAGLEKPDYGEVFLGEKNFTHVPAHQRQSALLLQESALFPHLTVAENLLFPLRTAKINKTEKQQRVQTLAQQLAMEACLDHYPATLSGGERQRVALGKVMLREPKLLLLDEPLTHLDMPWQRVLIREIRQVVKRLQIPAVYVTHSQQEALALGDTVGVLLEGKLQQVASAQEIYLRPVNPQVARFVGHPPMNLLPGEVKKNHFLFAGKVLAVSDFAQQGKAILAFRSQGIVLDDKGVLFDIDTREFEGESYLLHLSHDQQVVYWQVPRQSYISQLSSLDQVRIKVKGEFCQGFPRK